MKDDEWSNIVPDVSQTKHEFTYATLTTTGVSKPVYFIEGIQYETGKDDKTDPAGEDETDKNTKVENSFKWWIRRLTMVLKRQR